MERCIVFQHPFSKIYHNEFWALKNISFDIPKGTTVGIIGHNGSGKSTLLQIVCSVLTPTQGEVEASGRVAALLELGAGFNPEFTGHENVMMNGVLMGFSKEEMKNRVPLIKDFADIGDFFDQPVKIYSSGMFARLAFAAAINVDPDILVVDEALSVGDAKFQNKCFQKIKEFQKIGKTILLVTHDTSAITKHCDQAMLMSDGRLVQYGEPKDIVNLYLDIIEGRQFYDNHSDVGSAKENLEKRVDSIQHRSDAALDQFLNEISEGDGCAHRKSYNKNEYRQGGKMAQIVDYLVICDKNIDPTNVFSGSRVDIYWKAIFHEDIESPRCGLTVLSVDGIMIYGSNSEYANQQVSPVFKNDVVVFKASIELSLNKGDYFITLGCGQKKEGQLLSLDRRCSLIHLHIQKEGDFDGMANLKILYKEISKINAKMLL